MITFEGNQMMVPARESVDDGDYDLQMTSYDLQVTFRWPPIDQKYECTTESSASNLSSPKNHLRMIIGHEIKFV